MTLMSSKLICLFALIACCAAQSPGQYNPSVSWASNPGALVFSGKFGKPDLEGQKNYHTIRRNNNKQETFTFSSLDPTDCDSFLATAGPGTICKGPPVFSGKFGKPPLEGLNNWDLPHQTLKPQPETFTFSSLDPPDCDSSSATAAPGTICKDPLVFSGKFGKAPLENLNNWDLPHQTLKPQPETFTFSSLDPTPVTPFPPKYNLGVNNWDVPQQTPKSQPETPSWTPAPPPSPKSNLGVNNWEGPQQTPKSQPETPSWTPAPPPPPKSTLGVNNWEGPQQTPKSQPETPSWTPAPPPPPKSNLGVNNWEGPQQTPKSQPETPSWTPAPPPPPDCDSSESVVQGRNAICKGALIFSEEFDNSKVKLKDLNNWDVEVKFPELPDYPFNVYMADGTLKLEDGTFSITPILLESHFHEGKINDVLDLSFRQCTGIIDSTECKRTAFGAQILPPVMTGKITTRNKFNFKFGRIEIRARLPAGNWLIPELNLEPHDNVYGFRRYESGLMRVAFARGNPSYAKKLFGGPVLSESEPFRSLLMKEKIGIDNWNKDFHNYSLVWKPNGIELFVDGDQYGTVVPGDGFAASGRENLVPHAGLWNKGTIMAPLDELFYVSLGLRVGGVHDFPDSPDKPWKNRSSKAMLTFWEDRSNWQPTWYDASMLVDYVKVYAL